VARAEPSFPGWVEAANRRLRSRPRLPLVGPSLRPPEVGELCLAQALDPGTAEPALVCVTEVDGELATVRVVLASPETDLAAVADLLVSAADSGLPFDLMLESDVAARLWWLQVERRVAHLGPATVALLQDMTGAGTAVASAGAFGLPLAAGDDPRHEFKTGERARLDALAAVCEERAAAGRRGLPLVVDPLLLAALPGASSGSRIARIEAIAGELATAERSFVPGAAAAAALEAWDAAGSGRDPALWRALEPCLERALTAPSVSASRDVTFTPSRAQGPPWADEALAETCDGLLRGGAQSIRLLTMPCAWSGDRPEELAAVATARLAGGGALQLIRHHLEVNP
jgi:hypothetical protein